MLAKDRIEEQVAQLLKEASLGAEFPLPVEKVVEHLEFACHFYMPDKDVEDIASAVNHVQKKIYVNQQNSPFQQRLSIARAIGCIVLHGANQDYISYLHSSNDPKEQAVIYFAENLLMPETIFKQVMVLMLTAIFLN